MIQEQKSRPERSWSAKLICAGRSAYYRSERWRLPWAREEPHNRLVSVLIPTHNRVDLLLSRALPSVLSQSYPHLDIIVAAHGCTDDTVERVRALRDWRIRVVDVPRARTYPPSAENHWFAGPVAPLNAALGIAWGSWLARIDDDDEWTPDHLRLSLRYARESDAEFVSSGHVTPGGTVKPYEIGGVKIGGTQTWVWRSYLRFMRWNPDCWRKAHDRVNDTDLQARFVRAGVRMRYINRIGARILPRPGQTDIGSRAYLADRVATEQAFSFKP